MRRPIDVEQEGKKLKIPVRPSTMHAQRYKMLKNDKYNSKIKGGCFLFAYFKFVKDINNTNYESSEILTNLLNFTSN